MKFEKIFKYEFRAILQGLCHISEGKADLNRIEACNVNVACLLKFPSSYDSLSINPMNKKQIWRSYRNFTQAICKFSTTFISERRKSDDFNHVCTYKEPVSDIPSWGVGGGVFLRRFELSLHEVVLLTDCHAGGITPCMEFHTCRSCRNLDTV